MSKYFRVPFRDRAQAKALGARWAKDVELWFAPDSNPEIAQAMAQHWPVVEPAIPIHVFPGESTTFGDELGLALELIPSTCWLTNLRSALRMEDFQRVRMGVRQRAGKSCEICSGSERPEEEIYLEAHPRFEYVEGKQVLRRLMCVCTSCLRCLDFGTSQWESYRDEALAHLRKVNSWTSKQAIEHIHTSFEQWAIRSRLEWEADVSILSQAGVEVIEPSPEKRAKITLNLDEIRPKDMDISTFLARLPTIEHRKV